MKNWVKAVIVVAILGGIIFIGFLWSIGINNTMVQMRGEAEKSWANVESSYQRRADLIGNLVKTVQGAADFEKSTLTDVINARARATSVNIDASNLTASNIAQFQEAQTGLTGALSKLLVAVERYPDLKANRNFLELQSQLEGTENRINVARDRFNAAAGDYNIYIQKIPNNWVAGWYDFEKMSLFESKPNSDVAPEVKFDFDKKE
jgi:LemA protein